VAASGAKLLVNDLGTSVKGESASSAPAEQVAAEIRAAGGTPASCATGSSSLSPDDWRAVIDVHLNGSFYVARAAAPHFKAQESGAYIHMTSTSGLVGNLGQANYAAAKLGVVGLSKSIALDMRMISSIPTETPEQQARVQKLKSMATAKIAPLAVYLASEEARDVSGQILGGWSAQAIATHAMPALRAHFYALERSQDVFSWDPI